MKISVLTENHAGSQFLAEHGLSYWVETKGKRFLFDTGASDVFLKNAALMELDMDLIDTVVLSHGHYDHGGGLAYMNDKRLICHPKAFGQRYHKRHHRHLGLTMTKEQLEDRYALITTETPYWLYENVVFLGAIPLSNDFEAMESDFQDEEGNEDFVPDDSAVVVVEDEALLILSGCAHSGICNTIAYAQKVTGINKIKAIIGGFHLKHNNQLTQQTIDCIKKAGVRRLFPSHCTELPALTAFNREFKIRQVKTGNTYAL